MKKIILLSLLIIACNVNVDNNNTSDALKKMDEAKSYIDEGDYYLAIKALDSAIELHSDFPAAFKKRGDIHLKLENNYEAIFDYTKALELYPRLTDCYFQRALAKINLKDYESAIEDFTSYINITLKDGFSPDVAAYSNRAMMRVNTGDYSGSISDFTSAIELEPNNGSHYNNRGLSKINLGDYKSGCVDLSKALELNYSKAKDNINNYCI
jgi:tetratricopeptide (TPR) repeat protein